MAFQHGIDPRALLIVINEHLKVEAVISAGFADIGWCDGIIIFFDYFLRSVLYRSTVATDYFIGPSAGVLYNRFPAVFM